jgi:hypothetical protein
MGLQHPRGVEHDRLMTVLEQSPMPMEATLQCA